MSRPRFLADQDLNDHIVDGVLRHEPLVEFLRVRDLGMSREPDEAILEYAHKEGWLVVSHDVNTMPAAAYARLSSGQPFPGIFMARQSMPVGSVIDDLVLIWWASTLEDWENQVVFLPFA